MWITQVWPAEKFSGAMGKTTVCRTTRCRPSEKDRNVSDTGDNASNVKKHVQKRLKWVEDKMAVDITKVLFTDKYCTTLDGSRDGSKGWIVSRRNRPQHLRCKQGGGGGCREVSWFRLLLLEVSWLVSVNDSSKMLSAVSWGCRLLRLHLCRGVTPDECPGYDIKSFDGENPVIQELWGMRNTPSLNCFQAISSPECLLLIGSYLWVK